MRTEEEIIKKAEHEKEHGMGIFGITYDYLTYLSYEKAKEVEPNLTEADWKDFRREYTKESVIEEIKDYLPFAYEKAEGARGISSNRSIAHFQAWLWLIEDEELFEFALDDDNYPMYGFPILQRIAEKYEPKLKRDHSNIRNRTGDPVL